MNSLFWKSLALLAILAGFTTPVGAETRYLVEDLGALPGDYESTPWGINAHGDVVGTSEGPNGQRAFLYFEGAGMIELPAAMEGAPTAARDINDHGQVVGRSNFRAVSWDLSASLAHGFRVKFLVDVDLASEAMSVNNRGEIVGWFGDNRFNEPRHAFIYSVDGEFADITRFGSGQANDINDAGQIVGMQDGQAFVWGFGRSGSTGPLPEFGLSTAYGINEFGDLVGSVIDRSLTSQRAFKYSASTGLQYLGEKTDRNVLRRINSDGRSVGQGRLADGSLQAILHTDADGIQLLSRLIDDPNPWFVDYATDINDEGIIVASAWNLKSRTRHAVKLIPVKSTCLHRCVGKE